MNDSPAIPRDDPRRHLALARPDEDNALPHLGVVGDTYGEPVATRTESPPPLDEAAQAAFIAKSQALAPQYRTELLRP